MSLDDTIADIKYEYELTLNQFVLAQKESSKLHDRLNELKSTLNDLSIEMNKLHDMNEDSYREWVNSSYPNEIDDPHTREVLEYCTRLQEQDEQLALSI